MTLSHRRCYNHQRSKIVRNDLQSGRAVPDQPIVAALLQPAMQNPGNGARMRILVVDDEPAILRFVRLSLTAQGFDVVVASSGEECLALAASEQPDLVVLDMVMPGVDGFAVLQKLRDTDGRNDLSRLPVIACSAHSSAASRALSLGAVDFISKPFLPRRHGRPHPGGHPPLRGSARGCICPPPHQRPLRYNRNALLHPVRL